MSFLFEPENLLPYDGIAIYHGVVFNEQEANGICKDLFETIPWKQDEVVMFGKKIITKRKVVLTMDPTDGGFLPLKLLHLFAAARS